MLESANIPDVVEIPIEEVIETADAIYLRINIVDPVLSAIMAT
jgi:hypothetical protein